MTAFLTKRFAGLALAAAVAAGMAGSAAAAPFPAAAGHLPAFAPAGDIQDVGYRHRRNYGAGAGAAVALGIIGLGVAAIAAQQRSDRSERYYDPQPSYPAYYQPQYEEQPYYEPQPVYRAQPFYQPQYQPQPFYQPDYRQHFPRHDRTVGYDHHGRQFRVGPNPEGRPFR